MDNNQPSDTTGGDSPVAADPIRSRWTPKPEQILILESIFNSGMVNPPRDETVRIRKMLEKFGSVGDANVFYWFQNRRSRSRRRQRQLQASLGGASASGGGDGMEPSPYESTASSTLRAASFPSFMAASSSSSMGSVWNEGSEDLFSISQQMVFGGDSSSAPSMDFYDSAGRQHQSDYNADTISVYINGVLYEVPIGPFDMRSMFGHDLLIVHSSGEVLPVNDNGVLLQSLQMGESYYLIAKPN